MESPFGVSKQEAVDEYSNFSWHAEETWKSHGGMWQQSRYLDSQSVVVEVVNECLSTQDE